MLLGNTAAISRWHGITDMPSYAVDMSQRFVQQSIMLVLKQLPFNKGIEIKRVPSWSTLHAICPSQNMEGKLGPVSPYGVETRAARAVDQFERTPLGDMQHEWLFGMRRGTTRTRDNMTHFGTSWICWCTQACVVFGTVGEVSKGVRRAVRPVACLAADRHGTLSSHGTRCITRAHQETLLAGDFIGLR